jgi:hypothetical protein
MSFVPLQFFTPPAIGYFLQVNGAVRPGQPISVSWGLYGADIEAVGSVIATISLNGNVLYTSKSIAQMLEEFPLRGAGEDGVILPTPSQLVGQQLWAIGAHELTLAIAGGGSDKGPFVTAATLLVVGDGPDQSWWSWTQPTTGNAETVAWPLPYSPMGNLFNRSRWSIMKVQCLLLETDVTDGSPQAARGSQSVTADIGANANPVQFGAMTQNWAWVDSPTGRIVAPTSKEFSYVVNLTAQDAWGNSYPPVNTRPADVIVSVANNKINDAWGALNANASAAAAAVSGGITGIFTFGIGAAVGAAAAAAFLAVGAEFLASAKDPPSPDFNCLVAAKVPAASMPGGAQSAEATQAGKTQVFLDLVLRCMAIVSTLSQTEGKLIGARLSGNAPGIVLQTSTYRTLAEELMAGAQQLPAALAAAVNEVTAQRSPSIDEMRSTLRRWQIHGIPIAVEKVMSAVNCSSTTLATFRQVIASIAPENLSSLKDGLTGIATRTLFQAKFVIRNVVNVIAGNG